MEDILNVPILAYGPYCSIDNPKAQACYYCRHYCYYEFDGVCKLYPFYPRDKTDGEHEFMPRSAFSPSCSCFDLSPAVLIT